MSVLARFIPATPDALDARLEAQLPTLKWVELVCKYAARYPWLGENLKEAKVEISPASTRRADHGPGSEYN